MVLVVMRGGQPGDGSRAERDPRRHTMADRSREMHRTDHPTVELIVLLGDH